MSLSKKIASTKTSEIAVRTALAVLLSLIFVAAYSTQMVKAIEQPTTELKITKYADDCITMLNQTTVTWEWMRDNLPVYGDGVTHYYFQGPTFDDSSFDALWDSRETFNIDSRDYGAAMGTDVKDLCNLVGGASVGDEIQIKAIDGYYKSFAYEDVYNPEPRQGKLIVTWYTLDSVETGGGYVPDYDTGMRLIFFAETLNPEGKHVFGIWDMRETLAESRWHYYYDGKYWPSTSGLSVKLVSEIIIYRPNSTIPPETTTAPLTTTDIRPNNAGNFNWMLFGVITGGAILILALGLIIKSFSNKAKS